MAVVDGLDWGNQTPVNFTIDNTPAFTYTPGGSTPGLSGNMTFSPYVAPTATGGQPIGSSGTIDVNQLLSQLVAPSVSIPSLDYTPPSSADLQGKWKEFLDRAAKDPDIVNYYQKLLDQAAGDTKLAISFLDRDYTMGIRQRTDTLSATLQQLGLVSGQEQDTLANNLNQRQIALTDVGGGKTAYAAGGQPATELGQLNQGQKLRQEAEQRSAGQQIEGMGLSREKGITSAKQQLQGFGTETAYNKSRDIENRAQNYMGLYNAGESNKLLQAQINQSQDGGSSGGGSGMSDSQKHIRPDGIWDDNWYQSTGKYQ